MYGYLTLMISALLAGVVGAEPEKGVCYTVGAVNSVSDSMMFVCRVRDYAWPTQARFTVRLRNVEIAGDPNAATVAGRFLYERLTNARHVRLQNVQDRGYFRLTADVFVDGRDVAAEMAEYGLMVSPAITEQSPQLDDKAEGKVLWDLGPSAEGVRRVPLAPVAVRAEAIEKRLARQVDLSRIGPDTTFQEAMTILAEATEPRLPLLILWNDLERNAFVERDMPIGIEGFGRMRLDKALELILRAVSPPATPLVAVNEGGVLTIATGYGVVQKPRIGVYAVADLLSASSEDRDNQLSTGGASRR